MKWLLFSLTAFFLLPIQLPAADWSSDKYHISLPIPDAEGWLQQPLERSPLGESVLTLSNERQKMTFWLFVTGPMPMQNQTVKHPAMRGSVMKLLQSRDFVPGEPTYLSRYGTDFIQVLGTRKGAEGAEFVSMVRCAVLESRMYFMVTTGPGDEERAAGGVFPKLADGFRYNAPAFTGVTELDPLIPQYAMAYRLSLIAAGGLLILFTVMMYATRWKKHGQ